MILHAFLGRLDYRVILVRPRRRRFLDQFRSGAPGETSHNLPAGRAGRARAIISRSEDDDKKTGLFATALVSCRTVYGTFSWSHAAFRARHGKCRSSQASCGPWQESEL